MGECIVLYGKSASGKSRSLKGFAPDEIFYVNVSNKRLPFPTQFKYELKTADAKLIVNGLKKMPTKIAVIDDAGYIQTDSFMAGHSQPKNGSNQFELYNTIADDIWSILKCVKGLPDDVTVYMVFHEEINDYGDSKIRTIGKLLDQKVCIEGLCTVVLHCMTMDGKHIFRTNSDGKDIAKSPEDMFPAEIDNDLKAVDDRIREFWGIGKSTEGENAKG